MSVATRTAIARAVKAKDPVALTEARRNHAESKIADYIEKVVSEAPPLTDEQRDRLAAILRPVRIKAVDLAERERHADCANLDRRPAGGAA
ncbi:MAG: hypothetical protein LLG14_19600 [Nocardiaceae bacterium]|nr:hypothetical protein [Nocardiaceae bacterium]